MGNSNENIGKINEENTVLKDENDKLEKRVEVLKRRLTSKKRKISQLEDKISKFEEPKRNKFEPPKKRLKRYCISVTGFKHDNEVYNKDMKKELLEIISILGGKVHRGEHLSASVDSQDDGGVTHIVSPVYSRTMKVLQGVLKKKWIMGPGWLFDCKKSKKFLNEEKYGFKRSENPIYNKKVFLSKSFRNGLKKNSFDHCVNLVKYGGGKFIEHPESSDFILVGVNEKGNDSSSIERKEFIRKYRNSYVVSWAELIDIIYPAYLDRMLKYQKK